MPAGLLRQPQIALARLGCRRGSFGGSADRPGLSRVTTLESIRRSDTSTVSVALHGTAVVGVQAGGGSRGFLVMMRWAAGHEQKAYSEESCCFLSEHRHAPRGGVSLTVFVFDYEFARNDQDDMALGTATSCYP